ncbi:superinfection immunity protein [Dehalococcoides mccartyi]|uniref:superinfection immunity protein n=1 Tax=Dehalococcoides mccartyi TaxID=61435 RepID=UPI0008052F17|nr:superinfection immunity protein [Dehalococcoides mccartyi]OBW60803.1 MAG: superinfection immunity protein [Dehalococcoides mccartyi]
MFDFFFSGIFGLISFTISLALYFLPSIIALANHRRNTLAIFLLNLLLGWTFIGWVVALVWSVKK